MWFLFFTIFLFKIGILNCTDAEALTSLRHEASNGNTVNKSEVPKNFRLPDYLEPIQYTIRILPIIDDTPEAGTRFTAPGSIRILVKCVKTTEVITLHSYLLNITEDSVQVKNTASKALLKIEKQEYDNETHFYNITTTPPLEEGQNYEIFIEYLAPILTNRTDGLYYVNYVVPGDPEQKYMAITRLQSARARQVFPCFDEPRWKPIFQLTVGRNSNYSSFSNEKISKTEKHETLPGWFWDTFEPSAPMVTYLLAFSVADYEVAHAKSGLYRLPISVIAAPHFIKSGYANYAAEATANITNFFENLYGAKYPMSKVDSIVVPEQGFAMENYGLISYGDVLLYRDGETTEAGRESLLSFISHEIAHQWFGNLVTCKWWSDVWLNEGYATYASYIGMEPYHNEFIPRKTIQHKVQAGLKSDNDAKTHPLVSYENVNTIEEIDVHYDALQYSKGAGIIRMMEGFLTEENFNKGMRKYFQRNANKVAVQDDLFDALQEYATTLPADKTVKEIMDTWTLKAGYPLVRVSRSGSSSVSISQEHFSKHTGKNDPEKELWEVPVSITTEENPDFENHEAKLWLDKNMSSKPYNHNTSQWIMINSEGTGFYRVLYDDGLTPLINDQLNRNHSVISPLSRSQLLDDYIDLGFQALVSIESALNLTQYMSAETDFIVWSTVMTNLKQTYNLLRGTKNFDKMAKYFEPRLAGALKLIGVRQSPEDKGMLVILRAQLLDWACAMGNSDCVLYAEDLYKKWKDAGAKVAANPYPIDVQSVLYCATIAQGGEERFNFFLEKYRNSTSEIQKTRLVAAMGCSKDGALIDRLLNLSIDGASGISKPVSVTVLARVAANPHWRDKAFEFVQNSFDSIIAYHGKADPIVRVVRTLCSYYGSQKYSEIIRQFIEDKRAVFSTDEKKTLEDAIKTIGKNIEWNSKFSERITSWFEEQVDIDNRKPRHG